MNTTTMKTRSLDDENAVAVDDVIWLRRMSALYNRLSSGETESLIAWEHEQIAKTGAMRTADWPGWKQYIGPRPNRSS